MSDKQAFFYLMNLRAFLAQQEVTTEPLGPWLASLDGPNLARLVEAAHEMGQGIVDSKKGLMADLLGCVMEIRFSEVPSESSIECAFDELQRLFDLLGNYGAMEQQRRAGATLPSAPMKLSGCLTSQAH